MALRHPELQAMCDIASAMALHVPGDQPAQMRIVNWVSEHVRAGGIQATTEELLTNPVGSAEREAHDA